MSKDYLQDLRGVHQLHVFVSGEPFNANLLNLVYDELDFGGVLSVESNAVDEYGLRFLLRLLDLLESLAEHATSFEQKWALLAVIVEQRCEEFCFSIGVHLELPKS